MPYLHNLPKALQKLLHYRRVHRLKVFMSNFALPASPSIIDIGCGGDGRSFSDHVSKDWNIVGVDLFDESKIMHTHPKFTYVRGSCCDLGMFKENEFDLAVSVGMLEHILGDDYRRSVSEIIRVARSFMVLVPWRYAIVEPHFGLPFFGALPRQLQEFIIAKVLHRDNADAHIEYFRSNFEWRSVEQYKRDFPGARVVLSPTLDSIAIIGGDFLK
jgi:hypothetical protein